MVAELTNQAVTQPTVAQVPVAGQVHANSPNHSLPQATDSQLKEISQPAKADLKVITEKVLQLLSNLTLDRDLKVDQVFDKLFDLKLGGKNDEEQAKILGLNADEAKLVKELKFGVDTKGRPAPITNKVTGEVYINPADVKKAMLTNVLKLNFPAVIGTFFDIASKALLGKKKPNFNEVTKGILLQNKDFFEGVVETVFGSTLARNDTFSSLTNKVLLTIEKGLDKAISTPPQVQTLPINTPAMDSSKTSSVVAA